jgi:hypothetical protein
LIIVSIFGAINLGSSKKKLFSNLSLRAQSRKAKFPVDVSGEVSGWRGGLVAMWGGGSVKVGVFWWSTNKAKEDMFEGYVLFFSFMDKK